MPCSLLCRVLSGDPAIAYPSLSALFVVVLCRVLSGDPAIAYVTMMLPWRGHLTVVPLRCVAAHLQEMNAHGVVPPWARPGVVACVMCVAPLSLLCFAL